MKTPVTLGEGLTPLLHATRLGARLGLDWLYVKDESLNPTNSFKARGQSAAITRARALGVTTVSVPSAGNAGQRDGRLCGAGRAGREGLPAARRQDAVHPRVRAVRRGCDAGRRLSSPTRRGRRPRLARSLGWYDVSTLKEPYRIEGKKTMAYELAEQMEWEWPDWIVYPTGGGTGMVGMWKAFEEIERLGWVAPRTAAADGVGAGGGMRADRARLRAWRRACATPWENPATVADGLRVPRAIGDFLILRAVRESRRNRARGPRRGHDRRHARARQHGRDQRRARRRRRARRDSQLGGRRIDSLARPRGALQHGRRAEVPRRAAILDLRRPLTASRAPTRMMPIRIQSSVELRVPSSHSEKARPPTAMTVPPGSRNAGAGPCCSPQRHQRSARGREHRQSRDRGKRGRLRERAVERHGQREDGVRDDRDVRRDESEDAHGPRCPGARRAVAIE